MKAAAIWVRVSNRDQDPEQQAEVLEAWAAELGIPVVETFVVRASGWRGKHHPDLERLYHGAATGRFDVVLVWAIDRLGRQGPVHTFDVWRRLTSRGCALMAKSDLAITELAASSPLIGEFLILVAGLMASWESQANSERTKRAIDRKRAAGKRWGRPPGSKDQKPRDPTGQRIRRAREKGRL